MDKFHLVITGRRNTGKSSIVNTILQQDKAVVSPIAGTTTDPVKKSYEIPGVASVVLIDTAGTDDEGELGELRNHPASRCSLTGDHRQPIRSFRRNTDRRISKVKTSFFDRTQ